MDEWYSKKNLRKAWRYAKLDMRDDFVFDVINYEDIKKNIDRVISTLNAQLRDNQYHPAPLIHVEVPKNDHSVRPGSTIPVVDLIVLYAIVQQISPPLDKKLSESVYAYRLNPRAELAREPLYKGKENDEDHDTAEAKIKKLMDKQEEINEDDSLTVGFPYNWFQNWKRFHEFSKGASAEFEYCVVTDITGFFENITLERLHERLHEILGKNYRTLVDRLFRLLEFWNWRPSGDFSQRIGLPQGNDVSSFLSNIYLLDLDDEILSLIENDYNKYYRYVDDIKLFTSHRDEARKVLVKLETTLRDLNLNVQPAKTEIKAARDVFDVEEEKWLEKLDNKSPNKIDSAREFYEKVFNVDKLEKWTRVYIRCLTILGEAKDDKMLPTALELFFNNPSYKLLLKNFGYLKRFVDQYKFGEKIVSELTQDRFAFPFHISYLYKLAAYSRDGVDELKQTALEESLNRQAHWYRRMSALFCLSTFALTNSDLEKIKSVIRNDSTPLVLRATYVVLCQCSGVNLQNMLDHVSYFNAPHQDYLRRYFFRLRKDEQFGRKILSEIKGANIQKADFIFKLHQLDLLKSNRRLRREFREVIEKKIAECTEEWDRLKTRLYKIRDSFVENP